MIVKKSRDSSEFSEASSEFSEDPQKFLRIVILRIFCGSSSSEFSEDPHPQNFLRILRIFWGLSSSEFSEDPHPQNFLRILRIFWSAENSEGRQKVWGWGSSKKSDDASGQSEGSENFEGSSVNFEESPDFFDNHQKVLIYNENMLIKDQLLLQHISYKVRGYLYSKNTANIFSANCDSFVWISPASHHNFLRISSELSSEVCENYRTCLKISSEWTDQNFSRNLSRYQPQTLGISSGLSAQRISISFSGCHMISYHQSFRRITSEIYYRDRFSKFESGNASNRLALKDWGGCPRTCLFVIGARMPTWICCFFMKRLFVWLSGIIIITFSCENAAQDHPAEKHAQDHPAEKHANIEIPLQQK